MVVSNITLPLILLTASNRGQCTQTKVSTIITGRIKEHHDDPPEAEYEKQLRKYKEENLR